MSKIQLRGHCPYCGREQAVKQGWMAKHGYTVDGRWFNGVCSGQHHGPIEVEEKTVLKVIADIREQCATIRQRADNLESGKDTLEFAPLNDMRDGKLCKFSELPPYRQEEVTERAVSEMRYSARNGDAHADYLEKVRQAVHGKPLREVKPASPPAAICVGDRRKTPDRGYIEAYQVHQGRVYWLDERGTKGRMSTRSWRAMPAAKPSGETAPPSVSD